MGLTLSVKQNTTSSFKPIPEGMHLARCYRIIDLGTQTTRPKGVEKKMKKVLMQFEVHGEDEKGNPLVTDKGEPMSISKRFTASLYEMATLRKQLESWRSRKFTEQELRSFELKNVLGAWAMISVVKEEFDDGGDFVNIANIVPVPPAIKKNGLPDGFNELVYFDLDHPDMEVFNKLSRRLQETIQLSPEWKEAYGSIYAQEQSASARSMDREKSLHDMENDIPF